MSEEAMEQRYSWVYLSEILPLPLRGKHVALGSPGEIDDRLAAAGESPVLALLTFRLQSADIEVWVNPRYVVAVIAYEGPDGS